jgi:hypothetical protein
MILGEPAFQQLLAEVIEALPKGQGHHKRLRWVLYTAGNCADPAGHLRTVIAGERALRPRRKRYQRYWGG